MKILITGIYGFLGFHLARSLSKNNIVYGLYHNAIKTGLDNSVNVFTNLEDIDINPDVIVMCHAAVVSGSISVANNTLQDVSVNFTEKIIEKFPQSICIYVSSVSLSGDLNKYIKWYNQTKVTLEKTFLI